MTPETNLRATISSLREADWQNYTFQVRSLQGLEEREQLWRLLGREHGTGLDLFERLLAWPEADSRNALRYLAPAIAYVPATASQTRGLLLFAERAGDAARYQLVPVLKQLFAREAGLASVLGDTLRAENSPKEFLFGMWASAFVQSRPVDAALYVIALPRTNQRDRLVVASLLEVLPTHEHQIATILQAEENALFQALLQDAPHEGFHFSTQWAAIRKLAEFSPAAMHALMDAAEAGETPALIALANWLPGSTSATLGATGTGIANIVDLLMRRAIEDEELRNRSVDSAVSALLYNSNLRSIVVECVERLGVVDAPIASLFDSIFSAIAEEPTDMARLLTTWLVGGGISFDAIGSLLARYRGHGMPAALDPSTFTAAPRGRKEVAARRLLALTMDGPALCAFIGVLAESPALQPDGLQLAGQMLHEAFIEYPGATEDFLKERMTALPRVAPYAALYQAAHREAVRWRDLVTDLPRLRELRPTDTERLALGAINRRFSRDIHRQAERGSILSVLTTKVTLAQGRRFSSLFGPGAPVVTSMSEMSHEMELPTSEVSDPLGGLMRRLRILQDSQ